MIAPKPIPLVAHRGDRDPTREEIRDLEKKMDKGLQELGFERIADHLEMFDPPTLFDFEDGTTGAEVQRNVYFHGKHGGAVILETRYDIPGYLIGRAGTISEGTAYSQGMILIMGIKDRKLLREINRKIKPHKGIWDSTEYGLN